jgi:hypothetical protein
MSPPRGTTAILTALLLATTVAGCGRAGRSPEHRASPAPTSVHDVDPCTLVKPAVLSSDNLKQASTDKSTTSRSCSYTAQALAALVLVRWDSETLVDFATAFPNLVGNEELAGQKVVVGQSDARPACAVFFLPEKGTVVELVAGSTAPSATAGEACDHARKLATAAIERLREQKLLSPSPRPS